jgi:bacillithiol system protein YtxJ
MHTISTTQDLAALLGEPVAVLLKHSTHCPISAAALDEMAALRRRLPETPIYLLDVIAAREVSASVAARCGIAHSSPQAIVFRLGGATWHASHYAITAQEVAEQVLGLVASG